MINKKDIDYKQEILRKSIHLCSLSIPIVYIFVKKEILLQVLIIVASLFVISDILSRFSPTVKKLILKYFGKMLRPHELTDKIILNGASWVLISAVLTVLVFPKILAITGFAILIISDISAALFGRKFGKTPFFDKSMEGSFAFFVTASLVIIILGLSLNLPWTYFIIGFFAAFVGAVFEAASTRLKMDDNLSIPISIGLTMWLLGYYFADLMFHTPFIDLLNN